MSERFFITLFFAGGISLFLAYFVFGSFCYKIRDKTLIVTRKLFLLIPFGRREIPIANIAEIRRLNGFQDILRGAQVYGNLFLRRGLLVVLKRGFFKRLFITPRNLKEFTDDLEQRLNQRKQ